MMSETQFEAMFSCEVAIFVSCGGKSISCNNCQDIDFSYKTSHKSPLDHYFSRVYNSRRNIGSGICSTSNIYV